MGIINHALRFNVRRCMRGCILAQEAPPVFSGLPSSPRDTQQEPQRQPKQRQQNQQQQQQQQGDALATRDGTRPSRSLSDTERSGKERAPASRLASAVVFSSSVAASCTPRGDALFSHLTRLVFFYLVATT